MKPLTPKEAADYLGIKLGTLYCWTHEGFIPVQRAGRLLRFYQEELDKWLRKRGTPGRTKKNYSG